MGYFHFHSISDSTSKPPNFTIRRLVEYSDIEKNSFSDKEIQHLCSYISFNNGKKEPSRAVGKFLNKITTRGFGFLTMLDLEGVYKPALPETLRRKLPLLRHTTFGISICTGFFLKLREMTMSFQSTLKPYGGVVIGNSRRTVNWLTRLRGIRKLGLTCHTNSIQEIAYWISHQTSLQSLRLKSVDDNNKPSLVHFPSMSSHKMLSNLYLVGMLNRLDIEKLNRNLKVLALSGSCLSEDPMQTLEGLEHLKVLRLFANSYSGKKMHCHSGSRAFPQLQVLKLWMLTELIEWTINEGDMPALRDLEIRCCKRLEKPIGLENVTSLKELTLTSMKKDFVDEVKRSIGKDVVVIKNHWNFQPLFVSSFHLFYCLVHLTLFILLHFLR
ncbi:inactive disease susceptibility protein LOV1-like [Pistacia vera]|uniref:inactive disease susceptibility protein LOV1-like n=1 Tax=Pistacia vera TaxID=55513 RepID=UPI00126387C6|nr:inactive disease susceptibility protein LOV1-like [Pistacia vera]